MPIKVFPIAHCLLLRHQDGGAQQVNNELLDIHSRRPQNEEKIVQD